LYRGAWQEWSLTEADVLVPLSQDELNAKILAIFRHQSQKTRRPSRLRREGVLARVEARNLETAARPTASGCRVLRNGSLCNSTQLAVQRCTPHCPFIMLALVPPSMEEADR